MIISLNTGGFKADDREWRKMKRNLSRGQSVAAQVGWLDGRLSNNPRSQGITVAQIAKWLEEGHQNGGIFDGTYTVGRPFIRQGFMFVIKDTGWLKFHIRQAFPKIVSGRMTWTQFHEYLGKSAVELMKQTMDVWSIPANTQTTIDLKGFNNPLIETGETRNSITYKIGRKEIGKND